MDSNVKRAVDSIPAYVEAADLFVVLCPSAQHIDTHEVCDQQTWSSRGWCRVELAAAALGLKPERRLLVINSGTSIFLMFSAQLLQPPGDGDFAVQSDRVPLLPVLKQIVDSHLSVVWAQGNKQLAAARLLTAMRPCLLRGLGTRLQQEEVTIGASDLEAFRQQFRFSLGRTDPTGVGPWLCAAVAGDIQILRQLATAKASVNERVTSSGCRPDLYLFKGTTPLLAAAFYNGDAAVLRCLLELRADTRLADSCGNTALHLASMAGHLESVDLLLDRSMDIETMCGNGERPLFLAAGNGQPKMIELLIHRRAMVDARLCTGFTPLAVAAFYGFSSCCRLLLEHRAEVNHVTRPWGPAGWAKVASLRLASPLLPDSGPLRSLAMGDGVTALF